MKHEMYDIHMLTKLEQVKAISDPLRMKILTVLSSNIMTTKQVAEYLGETVNKLYYHVDALEEVGLIRLVKTQQNRGTIEKYYHAVARHFTLSPVIFDVRLSEDSEMAHLTFSSSLQATLGEIKDSLGKKLIKNHGKSFFSRFHIRTTPEKAAELDEKYHAFLKECEEADMPNGEVGLGLTTMLYPMDPDTIKPKNGTEKQLA
ncbi:MAG: helix-turn-helix domain-containing protein [Chloroherpetonaceae bacterium]|nr:helix-turn-helix domain-containing protein [Chloroherpetonaceae bacterium]